MLLLCTCCDDTLGKVDGALAALSPVVRWNSVHGTRSESFFPDDGDFGVCVCFEFVDSYYDGDTLFTGVRDVFPQIDASSSQNIDVFGAVDFMEGSSRSDLWPTTVDFERTDCGDDNDNVRHEAGGAAFDVEETLAAHREVEASFCYNKASLLVVVFVGFCAGKLECDLVCKNRAGAYADVGKGPLSSRL